MGYSLEVIENLLPFNFSSTFTIDFIEYFLNFVVVFACEIVKVRLEVILNVWYSLIDFQTLLSVELFCIPNRIYLVHNFFVCYYLQSQVDRILLRSSPEIDSLRDSLSLRQLRDPSPFCFIFRK